MTAAEPLDRDAAFPRLGREFLGVLDVAGRRRALERGTALYRAGEINAEFFFIGADPCTDWLTGALSTDADGFLLTGSDLHLTHLDPARDGRERAPLPLETSRPGVFAAGDTRSGSIKRVASAVGEGAMAVRVIHQYLALVNSAG